jgi:single-strand DNA-binding protein
MNRVILIGNLANDPESRTTQSGLSTCSFRLAVQRRFANAQGVKEADFINIVAWRQLAELCAKYLTKGRKIAVEGSLQTRSYDAQDGSKRYVTEVIADSVEFLGSNKEGGQNGAQAAQGASDASNDGFAEVEDDELPF